jgi:hypothetical protein
MPAVTDTALNRGGGKAWYPGHWVLEAGTCPGIGATGARGSGVWDRGVSYSSLGLGRGCGVEAPLASGVGGLDFRLALGSALGPTA